MAELPVLRRNLMLAIAVGQGLALLLLYRLHDADVWPSQSPLFSYPLWTLALMVPVLLLLSLESGNERRTINMVAAFSVVVALAAGYIGYQAEPFGKVPMSGWSFIYGFSISLAAFKALMYIQQRASGSAMSYRILFSYSWRNFLTFALALLFVGVFWALLGLWGQLFRFIGVGFFGALFGIDFVLFPLLGFAFGLGVTVFRNLTGVIDSITRLLHGLIRMLLPLVLFVAALFVISLPFAGLGTLWDTGRGTALLLWLLAIILFFVNAVYQDGRESKPYPTTVHRAVYAAICVTPVLSALSFYGLWLRVEQYGLTVARCWAFCVWVILTLFAVGYVVGVIRKRDFWTLELARVNTAMGLVILVLMLLVNTPLLDFRKISLTSQVARVEAGEVSWKDFDFSYLHRSLARPGYLKLQELRGEFAKSNPELVVKIDSPYLYGAGRAPALRNEIWEQAVFRPGPFVIPDALRATIEEQNFIPATHKAVFFRTDLDEDDEFEYTVVTLDHARMTYIRFYYLEEQKWRLNTINSSNVHAGAAREMILSGEIASSDPHFKELKIGKVRLQPVQTHRD